MPENTPRVLLTGAAGVLGRALAPALERAGFRVLPLDRAWSAAQDLCVADLRGLVTGCAGVVHLAGCSRVSWAEADPGAARRDNVEATAALLDAIGRQPRQPWLVFASSREVYGRPTTLPATERTPLHPANLYGETKAAAEGLLARARPAGLRAVSLRLTNLYGAPWDHPDRLVPALLAAARCGAPLQVRGPMRTLDLLHVDDAVGALCDAARHLYAGGELPEALNICSGQEIRLGDLAARLLALTGSVSPVVSGPAPIYEVGRFVGSPEIARQALGWTPSSSLDEGLHRLSRPPSSAGHAPRDQVQP